MPLRHWIALSVALFAVTTGDSCPAGTINLVLDAQGYHAPSGLTVDLHKTLNGSGSSDIAESADVSQGGSFEWKVTSNSSGFSLSTFVNPLPITSTNQLLTFCIEINQNISFNNNPAYTYTLVSLDQAPQGTSELPVSAPNGNPAVPGMGPGAALLIEELWAQHFQEVFNPLLHQAGDPTDLNVLAGAFQLAIWKIEYDHASSHYTDTTGTPGSVDFAHGFLRVSDPNNQIASTAKKWIDNLVGFNGNPANLVGLSSLNQQDQLVEINSITPFGSPVPEPASGVIWLVAGGLAVIARRGRPRAA